MKYSRLLLGIAVAMGVGLTSTRAQAAENIFSPYDLTYEVTRMVRNAKSSKWINLPTQSKTVSVLEPIPGVTGFTSTGDMTYNLSSEFSNYFDENKSFLSLISIPKDEKHVHYRVNLQAKVERPELVYILKNPDATRSTKKFQQYQYSYGTVDGTCQPYLLSSLGTNYELDNDNNKETIITRNMEPIKTLIHRKQVTYQVSYTDSDGEEVADKPLSTEFTVSYGHEKEKLAELSEQLSEQDYLVNSHKVIYDEEGNGKVDFQIEKNAMNKPLPKPDPGTAPELHPEQPDSEIKPRPEQPDSGSKPAPKPIPVPIPQPLPIEDSNNNGSSAIPQPDTNGNTNQLDNNVALTQSPEFKKLLDRFNQLLNRYTKLLEKQPTFQHKKPKHKHAHTKHKKRQVKQRKRHSKISKIKKQGQRLKQRQAKHHQSKHHSKNNHHLHHKKHA